MSHSDVLPTESAWWVQHGDRGRPLHHLRDLPGCLYRLVHTLPHETFRLRAVTAMAHVSVLQDLGLFSPLIIPQLLDRLLAHWIPFSARNLYSSSRHHHSGRHLVLCRGVIRRVPVLWSQLW